METAAVTGSTPATEAELSSIRTAMPTLEAMAKPATEEQFAVAMAKLFTWARVTGIDAEPATVTRMYRETLGDLPADLLMKAIGWTVQSHLYHNIPKPAEIRAHVAEESARRRSMLLAAKSAVGKPTTRSVSRNSSVSEKFARQNELSKNWPDPAVKKRIELKPIDVLSPHTQALVAQAKAEEAERNTSTGEAA